MNPQPTAAAKKPWVTAENLITTSIKIPMPAEANRFTFDASKFINKPKAETTKIPSTAEEKSGLPSVVRIGL